MKRKGATFNGVPGGEHGSVLPGYEDLEDLLDEEEEQEEPGEEEEEEPGEGAGEGNPGAGGEGDEEEAEDEGGLEYDDSRSDAMKAIADRRRKEVEAEKKQAREEGLLPPEPEGEGEEEEEPGDGDAGEGEGEGADTDEGKQPGASGKGGDDTAPPAPPVWFDPEKGEYVTKTKIDGQEQVVPYRNVQAAYQKHSTADKRLQEASQLLREAQEKATTQSGGKAEPGKGSGQPSSEEDAGEVEELAGGIIKELIDGDPDKATDMLANALKASRGTGTTFSEEDLNKAINENMVLQEAEKERTKAVTWYQENHPELANNPRLNDLVDQYTLDVFEDPNFDHGNDFTKIMQESVRRAQADLASATGAPPPKKTPTQGSRSTRKQTAASRHMAGGTGRKPHSGGSETQPKKDPKKVLEQLRKQRGQAE